jgi:hypothetical protein
VIAGPELFGRQVVRTTPYESDPSRWAVLDDGCAWQLAELPAGVLATLTRHFEVPTEDAKGPVRLSATVTVHRTAQRGLGTGRNAGGVPRLQGGASAAG